MNRLILLLITLSGASLLAACDEAELIVEAQLLEGVASDDAGGAQGISNLPIRLLPYDRDAIFDSLQAEHPTPEPERVEDRSEEHTSELQSRGHLVCRPLLEKKRTPNPSPAPRRHPA